MKLQLKVFLIIAIAAPLLTGCQSFSNGKSDWKPFPNLLQKNSEQDEFVEPVRMQAIWKEAVYEKPGSKATKGFGARIFFYDEEGNPVKADGQLTVYGFDDSIEKDSSAPDRKYEYKQATFQSHYGKTDLGHSYSIWLPWEKVGGMRKEVSLYPVFKTAGGKVLENKIALAVLPGKKPPEETVSMMGRKSNIKNDSNIQMASFDGEEGSGVAHASGTQPSPARKSNATTIRMTQSLSNHMKSLGPQATLSTGQQLSTTEVRNPKKAELDAKIAKRKEEAKANREKHPTAKPAFGKPGSFH